MASSSSNTTTSPDEEAVTLYLVSKLLGSNPKLSKTYEALVEDIESNELLGNTQDWTDNTRPRRLQDFDRKFHRLPSDQLLGHLRNSIGSLPESNVSKSTSTTGPKNYENLLLPLGGVLDLSTEKTRDSARRISMKLAKALTDHRNLERDRVSTENRLA